ncbi:MAG: cobalamin-dependent protein [Proteobacteria bacterium]|nr:cobalamin-dependent protein [Pseudomonadota bacterium]MBU1388130.1 cobalamin-dependent protein [Pseudomonadota bacterium]MBU1542194.1 cobalamin-dependent protein [Pseudomonadota bacterium]MBU2481650.1 cobalamin-dependent protein [Pseudomonadota bacterium]
MRLDPPAYTLKNPIKVITATALFDGHDAAINIIRRMLQDAGAQVVHIGHNRSVKEVVDAAVQEDVQGIAVSSYQGGHMEYFKYMVDLLSDLNCSHIKVFGGGGGVIIPSEIKQLHAWGITRIYSPEDGSKMGLSGMVNHMLQKMDNVSVDYSDVKCEHLNTQNKYAVAKMISAFRSRPQQGRAGKKGHAEKKGLPDKLQQQIVKMAGHKNIPVIGVTGTGGAGKSSLTDELINRLLMDFKDMHIAVICCDPSRRKTGGALLGDRIRMNAIDTDRVYLRSMPTGQSGIELAQALPDAVNIVKAAGYDLVIVETAGIGQGDSRVADLADVSVYVMTAEFGAPSQLEKIDMLDYADIIAINKFEKKGSEDAIKYVRKQVMRNRSAFDADEKDMPVYGTIASKFNDDGVTAMYHGILDLIEEKKGIRLQSAIPRTGIKESSLASIVIPADRTRYLTRIADTIRKYHEITKEQAASVRNHWHLDQSVKLMTEKQWNTALIEKLKQALADADAQVQADTRKTIDEFNTIKDQYTHEELVYPVRGKNIKTALYTTSLSNLSIPKISVPHFVDPGEQYIFARKENFPGHFPFTAGVFPLKRTDEEPTRMFAGQGGPKDTNYRFRMLSESYPAKRLSTAFDSVTLYGFDPQIRPDIYGKVGTSGVSICTVEDVKTLYDGFDLCDPGTSVSMTINGPAPIILAMFLNAAIDQQMDKFAKEHNRRPSEKEALKIRQFALTNVRGTVQADILKEDQGQNTCIFSIEFALKMMGDVQQYFIDHQVKNFYSVSISGYHIAEAGANPITQLALTLANGFTYVEYYLSRGMDIDVFAPSLSFFFSNGMDPEYTVIGRVARRIWALAMKYRYGAGQAAQKLKYHIQTSGRSLHSQDIQFNDIRTTLQGLCAIYDNCNSLHTNAYDEAITTPSAQSVRRALAIQLIINREWGLAKNENPLQGSFIVDELTDLVEEAVLCEFERITRRNGVTGAMEIGYQRGKIQEESMHYESLKHSGKLPLIGVNTFVDQDADYSGMADGLELSRATDDQKKDQLNRLDAFKQAHAHKSEKAVEDLKKAVLNAENIFEQMMETVKVCSLGTITRALYEVGGKYRRNM